MLYRLYDAAGRQDFENLPKLGAHLFRHTFAVSFIQAGGEIYHLSRLMGHSQIEH
jgi:site-specific recombinase XerD